MRITESQLRRVIREEIIQSLRETDETSDEKKGMVVNMHNLSKALKKGKTYNLKGHDGKFKFVDWITFIDEEKPKSLLGMGASISSFFDSEFYSKQKTIDSYLKFADESGKEVKFYYSETNGNFVPDTLIYRVNNKEVADKRLVVSPA